MRRLALSTRARTLKVARTIADLDQSKPAPPSTWPKPCSTRAWIGITGANAAPQRWSHRTRRAGPQMAPVVASRGAESLQSFDSAEDQHSGDDDRRGAAGSEQRSPGGMTGTQRSAERAQSRPRAKHRA